MRKRLRKKRRVGEFRENIFGVRFSMWENVTPKENEDFLDRFIGEAIEANELSCGGGGQGDAWEFYVQLPRRGSPTEDQRAAVGQWLSQQPEIRRFELSDFFDGWHGPDEAPYATGQTVEPG